MTVPELPFLASRGDLLATKAAALAIVSLFFLGVFCAIKFFGRKMSPSKVTATLKAALLGYLFLLLEVKAGNAPMFGPAIGNVAGLLVMLCLANLATYLVVDVYFYYRMRREVPSFLRDLCTFVVYLLFAMLSLRVIFRLDISSILTTTTVLTAAVAFAMQTTIANIISGFYVQNDRNLRLKNWIALREQGVVGEVVNVGFRYTTLKGLDNTRIMVPNNYIMQNVVTNLGYGDPSDRTRVVLTVGLGYDLPPERATALLTRILRQDRDIVQDPSPSVRIRGFADSSIEYDLVFLLKEYRTFYLTKGNILQRVWYAVTREGSSIPFPHREVITKKAQEPFPLDVGRIREALGGTEILQSLEAQELDRLCAQVHLRVFASGEEVVRQNDPGDSLFLVLHGKLEVRIDGMQVGALGAGDVFGEMSLLTGEPRRATVAAVSEVHLVEIRKEDIEPLLRSDAALLDRLSAVLAMREEQNVSHRKRLELSSVDPGRKESFRAKVRAFFRL